MEVTLPNPCFRKQKAVLAEAAMISAREACCYESKRCEKLLSSHLHI